MAATPEAKIKAKIDTMLKSKGPLVWFFKPAAGAFGKAGIPDYIICVRGNFFSIEAKATSKNKPTALQDRQMEGIRAAEGDAYVVFDSLTLTTAENHINFLLGKS
jgi:penicillin-binding protein-related factor A (putative recombinase)